MKTFSKFCALVASTMMLTVSAEAVTVINGYAITTNTYAPTSDWLAAVKTEFGATATVGTFEGLKAVFNGDTSGLATLLGGGVGTVTYGGSQTFSGRGYFLAFTGGAAPSNWTVHDIIGSPTNNSQITMGSWYDSNRIIAYVGTAVPEPSSVLVAGILGLGALSRRRRN